MFDTIKRLYGRTKNTAMLTAAVAKGWIKQAEADEITAE